jgi:2-polyprenyl-6-methoxyphenol hydroxylase-like FAD-dependent oxidoreductase
MSRLKRREESQRRRLDELRVEFEDAVPRSRSTLMKVQLPSGSVKARRRNSHALRELARRQVRKPLMLFFRTQAGARPAVYLTAFVSGERNRRPRATNVREWRHVETDLVIGADGIHSVLQREIGLKTHPSSEGIMAYRGLIPSRRSSWAKDIGGQMRMWLGRGRSFLHSFPGFRRPSKRGGENECFYARQQRTFPSAVSVVSPMTPKPASARL